MKFFNRTWATIDLDALAENFDALRQSLSCKTMVVLKADAYGHGDAACAQVLGQAGADWVAVSNLQEALAMRRSGVTLPVLVLGYTPPEAAGELAAQRISQAVFSAEYAHALSDAATAAAVQIDCHIKLDTGMSRIGLFAQQGAEAAAVDEIVAICRLPGLDCTGVFTHFASADEQTPDGDAFTHRQFDCFCKALALAEQRGVTFLLRHCCNSAAAIRFPQMQLDMVRLGIALYGLQPSDGIEPASYPLCPVLSLSSVVSMVKSLAPQAVVSYGRTYRVTEGARTIATLPVGYADGLRRNLGGKGRVLVHGCYAPIVGRVCMDQMMIDVTDIPDVHMGDEVVLIGRQGDNSILLDEWAALNNTIHYEETCLIGRRVPRVYRQGGQITQTVDYLLR